MTRHRSEDADWSRRLCLSVSTSELARVMSKMKVVMMMIQLCSITRPRKPREMKWKRKKDRLTPIHHSVNLFRAGKPRQQDTRDCKQVIRCTAAVWWEIWSKHLLPEDDRKSHLTAARRACYPLIRAWCRAYQEMPAGSKPVPLNTFMMKW